MYELYQIEWKGQKIESNQNVLLLGTGPSVLYCLDRVRSYIDQVNPIIISINGYLHGIRSLAGKKHIVSLPNKTSKQVDMIDISAVVPDIHFSFLKFNERTSPRTAIRGKTREHNLFLEFIENHKQFFLKHNIQLFYPSKSSYKAGTKFGYPSWDKNCYAFDFYPKKCKTKKQKNNFPLNVNKMFKGNDICFRAEHGGEYMLAWADSQNPKSFAICGLLDFPLLNIEKLNRGWFWVDTERNMPPKMSRNQSRIIAHLRKRYGDQFVDLNFTSWV